jgi:hypothetical protein
VKEVEEVEGNEGENISSITGEGTQFQFHPFEFHNSIQCYFNAISILFQFFSMLFEFIPTPQMPRTARPIRVLIRARILVGFTEEVTK